MCCVKCSSRNARKKKRRGFTMAHRCIQMAHPSESTELLVTTDCLGQVRWQGSRPLVKLMILTSTFRSLREYYVNTSSFPNLSTETPRHSWQTLSHSWWSLDLTVHWLHTEPSCWRWSGQASSPQTTCWRSSQKSRLLQLSLIMSAYTASILNMPSKNQPSCSRSINKHSSSKVRRIPRLRWQLSSRYRQMVESSKDHQVKIFVLKTW